MKYAIQIFTGFSIKAEGQLVFRRRKRTRNHSFGVLTSMTSNPGHAVAGAKPIHVWGALKLQASIRLRQIS